MTSKQRSYLKGLAMTMDPIFQIGKSGADRCHRRGTGSPRADQDHGLKELPRRRTFHRRGSG